MSRKKKPAIGQRTPPQSRAEKAVPGVWSRERVVLAALWEELRPERRFMLGLLVFAALLRFTNLTQPALWMDEITILQEAFTGKFTTVSFSAHSVHLLPVGFFMRVFGQNEFGLRVWGALLGTFAIPLLFIGMRWISGAVAARISGAIACVNCFLIFYAQDGNYYGGMTFYTAVMLCGFAIFLRGAPHAGFLVVVAAGFLNFKNHPIAAIPDAVMLATLAVASILAPRLRRSIYAVRPGEWLARPAVPILGVACIASAFFVARAWAHLQTSFLLLAEPGEGTLQNVQFGAALFKEHLSQFLVNFYHPGVMDFPIAVVLGSLVSVGLLAESMRALRRRDITRASFALLAIGACAASYYVLFSIQLSRNFYIRYFTYLVPLAMGLIGSALAMAYDFLKPRGGLRHLVTVCVGAIVVITGGYSARYLAADKRNEKEAVKALKDAYTPGDKFILLTRQDRIAANYYFTRAGLPTQSPVYTILQQPQTADTMGGAFPYVINGMANTFVISGWRFVEAPRLYGFVAGALPSVFSGNSKSGRDADARYYRISGDQQFVYPNAAGIFSPSARGRMITGSGSWFVTNEAGELRTVDAKEIEVTSSSSTEKWIPAPPAALSYSGVDAINWPENQTLLLRDHGLRNERDGSYDFLLYQPEGAPRQLSVTMSRDEGDPLLQKNTQPIPPGLLLAVAVDGIHKGFWDATSGKTITPSLSLSPGNHRITVSGLQPRVVYTPYFPWTIGNIGWNASSASIDQSVKSLEEEERLKISPGWSTLVKTGVPGERPSREWTIRGDLEVMVDPDLRCVGGDSPIRISFPPKTKSPFSLLTPAMPVQPGTLAVYTMFFKLEGLDDNEVTPIHVFISKDGGQIPGIMHANGSNIRGTTLGAKGWVRRQITVPVPQGAAFLLGGFVVYPVANGNTAGGKLWVGSVFSPGADDLKLEDPILPNNYFNVSESTAIPVNDASAQ